VNSAAEEGELIFVSNMLIMKAVRVFRQTRFHETLRSGGDTYTCISWDEYFCLFTPKPKAFGALKRGIERAIELASIR
jgi:hypothetical protein